VPGRIFYVSLMSSDRPTLIVTPYFDESRAVLEACIASVARQTSPADHILVADGRPADWIDALPVRHIRLDRNHNNNGNTPRAIGLMLGVAERYTGLALLDADNTLDPDHIETCLAAATGDPGCDYVVTRRRFVRPDGSELAIADEPVERLVDTSCFFFREGSYAALPLWGTMPKPLSPICDRIFYHAIRQAGLRPAFTGRVTVNYLVKVASFYRALGEAPPPGAAPDPDIASIQAWIDSLDEVALAQASRRAGLKLIRSPQSQDAR
jgi:glycosyltransferase involved in cell wall biosynthesis